MLGQLVKVIWIDAHGSAANATYDLDEIPHSPIEVDSYGILLKDDELGVSIASEICDKEIYRGYSFIPRVLIKKIEPVVKPRKKRNEESLRNRPRSDSGPPAAGSP